MYMLMFVFFYAMGAVLTYGYDFAYWQRKYPSLALKYYREDMISSLKLSLVWPFNFIVIKLMLKNDNEKHTYGFKLW